MQTNRDQPDTQLRYFSADIPRDEFVSALGVEYTGLLTLGETKSGSKENYKKRRERVVSQHPVTVHNAGDRSWDFEVNGFTFAPASAPIEDFKDRTRVSDEYAPRVFELIKTKTGANQVFLIGQQVRTEQTGRGVRSDSYARFAHSDYGPEFEPLFRRVLTGRYGFSKAEAESCGLCVAGYWAPFDRPAYKDPLCLLDCTSVDLEKEMVRYVYHFQVSQNVSSKRSIEEHIPIPAGDAPAIAPIYSPNHRWYFRPDMSPEEALIFKQYDFRENVEAQACWHNSFHDRFHDEWDNCPGRRSIELRLLLTFKS